MANGGKPMKPYVVQAVRDSLGEHDTQPVVIRHPVTETTASTLKGMMKQVVDANNLAVAPGDIEPRVSPARPTSPTPRLQTSKRATPTRTRSPSRRTWNSTLDNPRLAILVKLDDLGTADLGGELTAPIFSKLMHDGLIYLHVPQDQPQSGSSH